MPQNKKNAVSQSVINRLPRYHRYLSDLSQSGVSKISSKELAEIMNLTASQIRQDLNCFGGFGQQGYGYNVSALRDEIGSILGLEDLKPIIQIGAGNLGKAIATHISFSSSGFNLIGIFDADEELIGRDIKGHKVRHFQELKDFCMEHNPRSACLCIPREAAQKLAPYLIEWGIRSFLNFSHYDIANHFENVAVENVHIGDTLKTLSYTTNALSDKMSHE